MNAPILRYPDFDKPVVLTKDASTVAISGILSQGPNGTFNQFCLD